MKRQNRKRYTYLMVQMRIWYGEAVPGQMKIGICTGTNANWHIYRDNCQSFLYSCQLAFVAVGLAISPTVMQPNKLYNTEYEEIYILSLFLADAFF